jgi:hypothetical protein
MNIELRRIGRISCLVHRSELVSFSFFLVIVFLLVHRDGNGGIAMQWELELERR